MIVNLKYKRIAVFGFDFKKNTSDTRESAAAYICDTLLKEEATIHVFDPKVTRPLILAEMNFHGFLNEVFEEKNLVSFTDPYIAAQNTCAILIMTEWDLFTTLDYQRIYDSMQKPAFIFDGRNILDHQALKTIGFRVVALGKSDFSYQEHTRDFSY